jgi:hypothetical protein
VIEWVDGICRVGVRGVGRLRGMLGWVGWMGGGGVWGGLLVVGGFCRWGLMRGLLVKWI